MFIVLFSTSGLTQQRRAHVLPPQGHDELVGQRSVTMVMTFTPTVRHHEWLFPPTWQPTVGLCLLDNSIQELHNLNDGKNVFQTLNEEFYSDRREKKMERNEIRRYTGCPSAAFIIRLLFPLSFCFCPRLWCPLKVFSCLLSDMITLYVPARQHSTSPGGSPAQMDHFTFLPSAA